MNAPTPTVAPPGTNEVAPLVPPPSSPNPLDEPTFEECHAEWVRYFDTPAGVIDPGSKHSDEFVAFYDGKAVDYDPDPTELRDRAASTLSVHPARLVIAYLGDYYRGL